MAKPTIKAMIKRTPAICKFKAFIMSVLWMFEKEITKIILIVTKFSQRLGHKDGSDHDYEDDQDDESNLKFLCTSEFSLLPFLEFASSLAHCPALSGRSAVSWISGHCRSVWDCSTKKIRKSGERLASYEIGFMTTEKMVTLLGSRP